MVFSSGACNNLFHRIIFESLLDGLKAFIGCGIRVKYSGNATSRMLD